MNFVKPIFLGMIAAGGALVFELLVSSFFPSHDFSTADIFLNIIFLIILAAIEEFFKLLVIYKSFYSQKNNGRDFLQSSLLLGFGFSLAEIAISGYFSDTKNLNLYLGIMGIIFIHTLSAGLIGWFLLKIKTRLVISLVAVFLIVTMLHFAYNTAIITGYLQK
jgi:hypothetical protein